MPNSSRIGLGCATFGREIGEADAFRLMDHAVAHGITLFDTAESYGGGQAREGRRRQYGTADVREVSDEMHSSEKIVGRWLRSRGGRDRIALVTKVSRDYRRDRVRTALEDSLRRLQTDRVDLYLYHSFDAATPVGESVGAMDAVIRSGLARRGGCSNYDGGQLGEALAASDRAGVARFAALETGYNLLRHDAGALRVARESGLHVLGYSPLAAGFLSGKYGAAGESVPPGSRFDVIPGHGAVYFRPENFRRVALLHAFARSIGVPPLRLALAWALQNPAVHTVLVGARTIAHLDNALAAQRLAFSPDWLAEIERWNAPTPAAGRVPAP